MPRSQLATGTVISDQASIVFDANAAIATPQWSNGVDNISPSSYVNSLTATQATSSFLVQWTGNDVGGGVAAYDIYVSDNGSGFAPWLTQIAATSATYAGQQGHNYGFYSIARDLAGNFEPSKTSAEASTTAGASCSAVVTAQVTVVRSGFRLNNATGRFLQTVTLTKTARVLSPLLVPSRSLLTG